VGIVNYSARYGGHELSRRTEQARFRRWSKSATFENELGVRDGSSDRFPDYKLEWWATAFGRQRLFATFGFGRSVASLSQSPVDMVSDEIARL
jgi:hypothetical protein